MEDLPVVKRLKVDDCVKMKGGKNKGCEGVIVKIMKLFCSIRITKDKKGGSVFSDKPSKVKREHIIVIPPPAIEMPTDGDLKAVDDLEPLSNLINDIDEKLINESKTENIKGIIEEVEDIETGEKNPNLVYSPKKNATLIDEHGCRSDLPTIDDAINLRDENQKLKLQIESLLSWQSRASEDCAKYRKDYDDLKKRFDESINSKKEDLLALIKNM